MQAKKKICSCCSQLKYIWKNYQGERFCQQCWSKQTSVTVAKPTVKQKPISRRSPKRAKEEREYSLLRIDFLTKNYMCQAHLPGCTGTATDVHHTYSGKDRSEYFLKVETWLALCRNCHDWIHSNSRDAREMGLLK